MNDQPNEQQAGQAHPAPVIVLRYAGNDEGHGHYIEGVPAMDLTQEQIDRSGYTVEQLLAFSGPAYQPAIKDGE